MNQEISTEADSVGMKGCHLNITRAAANIKSPIIGEPDQFYSCADIVDISAPLIWRGILGPIACYIGIFELGPSISRIGLDFLWPPYMYGFRYST